MSSSTDLPGKGAMHKDQYGRTWFVAAGDEVPDEWTKVEISPPLPGEQLDPNVFGPATPGKPVTTATTGTAKAR